MASRENQTMQGVVIALSLLMILLLVGLFLINNERNKQKAAAESAAQRASEAQDSARSAQAEANRYKVMMGFKEDDTRDTVEESFKEDMETYGKTFDETDRFYSPLLQNLQQENHKLMLSESGAKKNVRDLKDQLLAIEKEKDDQIAKYQQQLKEANEQYAAERAKFTEDRNKIVAEREQLSSQLQEQQQKISELTAQQVAMQKEQEQELRSLGRDIELLRNNQLEPDPFAQPADGIVRWVNQKEQKVWINIGEKDHLRPQVTFSVYSGDESDAMKAETKGSIEVTMILGPHMAEARITSDKPTRPIMEGDKIYSQVWNRGRQVGFAITGLVDLDDDGKSDLDELKSIIAINNGKVDAEPGPGGTVKGDMTVGTRFLIMGEYPESTLESADELRRSWDKMAATADRLGIETITLDEFLRLMGWKRDRKTVALGVTARPEDFPATRQKEFVPRRSKAGTGSFIPRKPQPTY